MSTMNNIFASYDASKVTKILVNASYDTERKAYYEGMGVTLENVNTLESALKISGLNFEVKKLPLFHGDFDGGYQMNQIPEYFATVRDDTKQTLGIVGKDYQVLQNKEAFEFLDSLVAIGGAKFTSAGDYRKNGAASYIQMSTEPMKILDDEFENYIVFSNGHDGNSCVSLYFTPIRVWCKNTFLLSLKKAKNRISIKHTINMHNNLERAKETLVASSAYLSALKEEAEKLAVKPFSEEAFKALAYKLFPVKEDVSETVQIRNLAQIEQLFTAYQQDDLQNFNGTAYKVLQAIADAETRPVQFRKSTKRADNGTQSFQNAIIYSMPLLNKAFEIIKESV